MFSVLLQVILVNTLVVLMLDVQDTFIIYKYDVLDYLPLGITYFIFYINIEYYNKVKSIFCFLLDLYKKNAT